MSPQLKIDTREQVGWQRAPAPSPVCVTVAFSRTTPEVRMHRPVDRNAHLMAMARTAEDLHTDPMLGVLGLQDSHLFAVP